MSLKFAQVLPAVVNFAPDLILVSAGFDAHRKDEINFQFVGVREHDFAWVTDQLVQARRPACGCGGLFAPLLFHNRGNKSLPGLRTSSCRRAACFCC